MTERWEHDLQRLRELSAPARTKARIGEGPTRPEVGPPMPPARQRIVAGLVAVAVFGGAVALAAGTFGGDDAVPLGQGPEPAVITLTAGVHPEGTLTYGARSAAVMTDSYCWDQGDGVGLCVDFAAPGPFAPGDFLQVTVGTPFLLVNDDGADPVALALAPGNDPLAQGSPSTLDELASTPAGRHVVTVTADWDRGEAITFRFALEMVEAPPVEPGPTEEPSPEPSPPSPPSPDEPAPPPPGSPNLAGTSWELEQLGGQSIDPTSAPTLFIGATRLGGSTGCNSYGGDWQLEGEALVTSDIVMTLIGCSGEVADVEARFTAILDADPVVSLDATVLRLTSSTGDIATFARIDVDHADIQGSFLDCDPGDQVELRPPDGYLEPAPPDYIRVNVSGIAGSDDVRRIDGSADFAEPSTWVVVRDGLVVAEIDYPRLDGVACRGSGVGGA